MLIGFVYDIDYSSERDPHCSGFPSWINTRQPSVDTWHVFPPRGTPLSRTGMLMNVNWATRCSEQILN